MNNHSKETLPSELMGDFKPLLDYERERDKVAETITEQKLGATSSFPEGGLTDIDKMKITFAEIGLSYTVRSRGEYEYLFIGRPEHAKCLTGPNDNFETTDLDALNCRHGYFEFENGELVSWTAS